MKKLGYGAFAVLTLACLAAKGDGDFTALFRRYQGGTALIMANEGRGKQSTGSGFVWDERSTLITSAHVVQQARSVYARFPDGKSVACRLLDSNAERDLAALRLDNVPSSVVPLRRAGAGWRQPEPLDEVLLISSPRGLETTPHIGTFSGTRWSDSVETRTGRSLFQHKFQLYQLNISAAHGSSGGPVLDSSGYVIGLLVAGLEEGRLDINFAVPCGSFETLNLGGQGKQFSQQDLALTPDFDFSKLSYKRDSRLIRKEEDDLVVDYSLDSWGFVDPSQVKFFVDDAAKFTQLVSCVHFDQLIQRNRMLHVVSAPYRFRMIIVESSSLSERLDDDVYTLTITHRATHSRIVVRAENIPPVTQSQLIAELDRRSANFVRGELGLQVYPGVNPAALHSGHVTTGPLSDPEPRTGVVPGTVKIWRQYVTNPMDRQAWIVMYGINRDTFITSVLSYRMDFPAAYTPAHLVERVFMAATLSFL